MDTVREGEGGTNWKTGIDMYTLPGVKHIASGKLVYRTGSSARRSVMTERGGRKVQVLEDSVRLGPGWTDACCTPAHRLGLFCPALPPTSQPTWPLLAVWVEVTVRDGGSW